MHLAVLADDRAVASENDGGVVINPRGALLEQRGDDDDFLFLRQAAELVGRRPGDRLGELKKRRVLDLRKIARAEKLLEADDIGALLRRRGDSFGRLVQIRARIV